MKYALSIDMDFWNRNIGKCEPFLHKVLKHAKKNGLPILFVMNHQQLLPFINASNARTLVNVDEHSDLSVATEHELTCGSWVSYVKWRSDGVYAWLRNSEDTEHGQCNGRGSWNMGTDWWVAATACTDPVLYFQRNRGLHYVERVGVCLSPEYTNKRQQKTFYDLLHEYAVPYKKGRLAEESLRRKAKPPKSWRE